jgi:hypothetical protein
MGTLAVKVVHEDARLVALIVLHYSAARLQQLAIAIQHAL